MDPVESEETLQSSKWSVSPPLATVLAALFALAGGVCGAVITGYFDIKTQEQQTQTKLVIDAIDSEHEAESAKRLRFLANAGLIPKYKAEILKLPENAVPALKKPVHHSSMPRRDQLHQAILVLADGTPIPGENWSVTEDFIRDDGKIEHDVSGAACANRYRCVLVGNGNRFVYVFKLIDGQVISRMNRKVYVMQAEKEGQDLPHPDLETGSYDDGWYMFVGSHSAKKSSGCRIEERHNLFLLSDEFLDTQEEIYGSSIKRASLDYFFEKNDYFKEFYDELLQFGGVKNPPA